MKKISKTQKDLLDKAGLLKNKKKGVEPNYTVANKCHKSRAKTYYIEETKKILDFLDSLNTK